MSAFVTTAQAQQPRLSLFNCRAYVRQSCDLDVVCQPAAAFGRGQAQWFGTIRDVSQGGIRLTLERRFEPGTGLAVELPEDPQAEARTVLSKVVHVRRQADGQWSLGCKFISELSEDEVQRLLPETSQAVGTLESRATHYGEPRTVSMVRLQIQLASATLIDCVVDQMVVPSAWPLAAGKSVTVHGGKTSGSPWQLQLRIVQCAKQSAGWVLHGQLQNGPPAAELLEAIGRRSCVMPRTGERPC
jgi:hypothetical protein